MADRRVSVEVEVNAKNKAGPAMKEAAKDIERAQAAATGAAAGGSSGGGAGGGAKAAAAAAAGGFGPKGQAAIAAMRAQFAGAGANLAALKAKVDALPPEEEDEEEQKKSKLREAFDKLTRSIGMATAAATGFVAAGNPILFSTFTGSIRLLSIQVSRFLTPAFVWASGAIQRFAGWLKSIDDETRSNIGTFLKWGAVIAIGSVVLAKTVGVIAAVGGAIKALSVMIFAFSASNPMVLAIMAIAGAVAYLSLKLGFLDGIMDRVSGRSRIYAGEMNDVGRAVQTSLEQPVTTQEPQGFFGRLRSAGSGEFANRVDVQGRPRADVNFMPRIERALRAQGVSEEQITRRLEAIRTAGLDLHTTVGRRRASMLAQTQVDENGMPLVSSGGFQARTYQSGSDFYSTLLESIAGQGPLELQLMQEQLQVTRETLAFFQNAQAKAADNSGWGNGGGGDW